MSTGMSGLALVAVGWVCCALSARATADPVADFYRGKQLEMLIPASAGGDYDVRARLVARHIGRHIPGTPSLIPRNMPAGVGIGAANYLAKAAPRDGTVIHAIFQNIPILQAIGRAGIEYDVRKFLWLGNTTDSPNVINSWHTTGITSVAQVMERELVVGAPGVATASYVYPSVLNQLAGAKFKIITGYPGGNEVNLAMEKGEVGGRGSNVWASWKRGHPQWIAERKIHMLVQIGLTRAPDLPDVPLMFELARNDADRELLKFLSADTAISRAFVTGPDVPADRVAALRRAFDAAMKDPELLADAAKQQMEISASTGDECQKVSDMIIDAPAELRARAKVAIEGPGK